MTLTDAVLILLLVARIHGTDDAVRAAAKRCSAKLPRRQRILMFNVINSRSPLELVSHMAQELDDELFAPGAEY
jgi:hypothetical protein